MAARIASGPGFWTQWLSDLGREGLLEQLLADDVIGRALREAPSGHRYDRALNAKMTVICVLVACLFPGSGYDSVLATAFGLPGLRRPPGAGVPTGAAFSQARKLLGEQVMKRLFELDAAVPDADLGIGLLWKGLEVTAIDGTTMELGRNGVLEEEFGTPADGARPLLRVTAHVRTSTFRWIGAAVGGYHDGENALADELEGSFRPGIINLADRGFFSMHRWLRFSGTGADLAWRVKNGAKSVPARTLEVLPDGSELVVLHESGGMHARRRKEAPASRPGRLPDTVARLVTFTIATVTASGKRKTTRMRVLTTLLDHEAYPAAEIAALYAERWQIEMVFTQLTKRAVRPVGGSREHVADLDVAVGDDDAVDEQLGQLPPLLEGGGGQAGADGAAECLDPVGDGTEFQLLPGGGVELALLGEQGVAAAVQVLALAVELGQGDHFGEVGVQQPLLLAVQLAQGAADGGLPGLEFLRQPGAALGAGQRPGDVGGVGQQRAQVGPDQLIQLGGGDVAGGAALPLGYPQRVGAAAAQVVAVALGNLAAGAGQPARAAADQRAQQVLMAGVTGRTLLVGIQLGLHPGEDLLADDRRDRHRDPVLLRPRGMALARPGRQHRRLAAAGRRHLGAVGQRPAGIGRVPQDAPDAGHVPARPAHRGGHPQIGQPRRELVDGCPGFEVPVEQLGDQHRLPWVCPHRIGPAGPLRVQPVPERGRGPRQQRARPQLRLPATAHPLGDQRPLILRDRAADLQQQLVMRVGAHRPVQELHPAAMAGQLLDQQHLVDVVAGQPVRRGHQDNIQLGQCRVIAQPV